METRYQVFVSSTYTDLVEERRAVMQCLLTMDCIPAGMELFPAADESAWGLIESVIKDSDYYVLILGGRYGTASKDNPLSYTEREYNLAIKLKVPVLAFLHKDPGKIVQEKTDVKDAARQALNNFRKRIADTHHVNFWTNPDDLASKAMLAIRHATKTHPRIGWIRADQAMDARTARELERLRRENDDLLAKAAESSAEVSRNASELACSDELVPGNVLIRFKKDPPTGTRASNDARPTTTVTEALGMTWTEVFGVLGPKAMEGMTEYGVSSGLRETIGIRFRRAHPGQELYDLYITIPDELDGRVKTQFMALGWWKLERPSGNKGYIKWWLTEVGRTRLVEILSVRKVSGLSTKADHANVRVSKKRSR